MWTLILKSLIKKYVLLFSIFVGVFVAILIGLKIYDIPENRKVEPQTISLFEISSETIKEPLQPIPLEIELNLKTIELGNKLFHDPVLSGNNTISCASCHDLHRGGTDRSVVSTGINGQKGTINAPTVFNSVFNFKQFWDGRSDTLEEQMDFPIHSPIEMGSGTWQEIINKLQQEPEYKKRFRALYKDGITPDNLRNAIATFERSLITPNSRFDKFLRGDDKALDFQEKEGYRLFKSSGCAACHQGINIGGNMFQSLGLFGNYLEDRGHITPADSGRYNVTKDKRDLYVFKVPSLRNIALTAPYFHDGSIKNLASAVRVMSQYQLGRELSESDIDAIVKFLRTLTGEYQGEMLQ